MISKNIMRALLIFAALVGSWTLCSGATPDAKPYEKAQATLTPPPAKKFYIFLLAGQSNMAGRGKVAEIDRTPNPRILAFDSPGRWVPAIEPLHKDKPKVAGVGPGLAFARELLQHLPDDVSIGLIPAAFGGTSISKWHKDYKGAADWPDGRSLFQLATESANAAAKDGIIVGILWNQGEANTGQANKDNGATYRNQLDTLIADFRAALNKPELPFVAATLGPWRRDGAKALNQVYIDMPKRVPHTAVVNTLAPEFEGKLRNKPNDIPHYDAESARLLGQAYAKAMLPLITTGSCSQ